MIHTQWPALWSSLNLLTGLSYLAIALIVVREQRVRVEHWLLFATFVAACGWHHLVHVLPILMGFSADWLDAFQLITDAAMTGVSLLTAVILSYAYYTAHRRRMA